MAKQFGYLLIWLNVVYVIIISPWSCYYISMIIESTPLYSTFTFGKYRKNVKLTNFLMENKRIIKFFLSGLVIFKIFTVGLSITAYQVICLHTFVLCDYNQVYQVLCPNTHTAKQCIKAILWYCAPVVSFDKTKGWVGSFFWRTCCWCC